MEEELVRQLLANAGLTAVFGTRITWNTRPQAGALPALVLQVVSAAPDYTYDGRQGLRDTLVQMDIWAGTFATAKAGSRALVLALDTLAEPFKGAFVASERDSFEQGDGPQTTGSVNFHRVSIDVRTFTPEP